jgi:hypothetical protein
MKQLAGFVVLVMLVMATLVSEANASPKLTVGTYTMHSAPSCNTVHCEAFVFNTANHLITLSNEHVVVGRMINSYYNESFLLGFKNTKNVGNFQLNYGVIFASGYPKNTMANMLNRNIKLDDSRQVVITGPLLSLSYRVTPNVSFDASTQGSALNLGVGFTL